MTKTVKNVVLMMVTTMILFGGFGAQNTSAAYVKPTTGSYTSTNTSKFLKMNISKVTPDYVYMTAKMKNGNTLSMTVYRSSGNTVATNLSTKKKVYGIRTYFNSKTKTQIVYPSSNYTGTRITQYSKDMSL
ncbi:hypothetical protein CN918_31400 [Priestia megaterium]|nr:hypothetical protein CN918_31400 [Priestia megaterium]